MQQLILTIIFYMLIIAILVFVGLIWREGARRRQTTDKTLIDAALTSAQAANKGAEAALLSAQTARDAVETIRKLVTLLEQKHAES